MPRHSSGARSQQFAGLPSRPKDTGVPAKRPREDFVDSRFKFASAASQAKKLKPNLSNLVSSKDPFNLESEHKKAHECHFTDALQDAALHNLSIPFKQLRRQIEPLTRTLPLLILHQDEVVHACCQALIVQDTDAPIAQLDSIHQPSGQTKKNRVAELEKERKNRALQAKQAVNLVATSVLDLFVPLIFDLSTSLLTPFKSNQNSDRCPFDELLMTLLYFINLSDVEPTALSRATQVMVQLFKTLAKDLTPSSSEEDQLDENIQRLKRIWQVVRNALGAPLPTGQELRKTADESSDAQLSDLNSEEDLIETEENLVEEFVEPIEEFPTKAGENNHNEDAEIPELIVEEADLNQDSNKEESRQILTESDPDQSSNSKDLKLGQLLHHVFKSTTPSSRRLVATSFAYLLRKKGISDHLIQTMLDDLNVVEINELSKYGTPCSRKHKVQGCRKGTSRQLLGEEDGSAYVFAEGISWALAEACKSIDRRLHSHTPAIVMETDLHLVLLARQNASKQPALASRVLNSLLTSIIHHTTAQHLEPVLDVIVKQANERLGAIKSDFPFELDKKTLAADVSLQCLATVSGVRDGSRLSVAKRSQIFEIINSVLDLLSDPSFSHSTSLDSTVTFLSLNLLNSINDHSEFLSAPQNRTTVDKLFAENSPIPLAHLYQLASTLHRLKWPFFDAFLLPKLLTRISTQLAPSFLPSAPELTASLLADLLLSRNPNSFKKLFDLISIRIDQAINVTLDHLSAFHLSPKCSPHEQLQPQSRQLEECYDWISLCAVLPMEHITINHDQILKWYQRVLFTALESSIINNAGFEGLREKYISDYQSGVIINRTLFLSAILDLSRRFCFSGGLDSSNILLDHLPFIVKNWGWHRGILKVVRDICHDAQGRFPISLSFESMYQPLKSSLLCETNLIRLLTLEILVKISPPDSPLESLLKQCLKIEETPLLVENARIRQMHIRKLSIMVISASNLTPSADLVDIAQRILIAQLKVHFQPLWEESIKALTDLNEKYHANFWTLVWSQLDMCLHGSPEIYCNPRVEVIKGLDLDQHDLSFSNFTDQPEFICTHLEKMLALFSSHCRNRSLSIALDNQSLDSRLDIQSYEAHLLTLLTRNHPITEKHNKLVIDAFFIFCQAREEDIEEGHLLGRSARSRLRNWLEMFSKFTNPKAFYRSQDLRAAFYDLLADPDSDLRRLSLECVLTWKDSSLVRNQDDLRNLLEPSQLRDTLLKLSHAIEEEIFAENEREEIVPVVIRLLFGYLLVSPGRSSASHGKTPKRSAVLSAMKGCTTSEINLLIALMLRPLTSASKTCENLASKIKKHLGFLSLLGDVMKTLGRQIVHRWEDFLTLIIEVVTDSQSHIKTLANDVNSQKVFLESQLRKVRSQCLRRLNEFFQLSSPDFSFDRWVDSVFSNAINPKLPTFASETAQAPSALLEIIYTWSRKRDLMPILIKYNPQLLASVFQTLATKNVKPAVVKRVIEILENILHNLHTYPIEFTAEQYLQPYFDVLLPNLAELLRKASNSYSLTTSNSRQQISLLSTLAPYITETSHSESFCELILPLLSKNQVTVPEYIQADLLNLLSAFLSKAPKVASSPLCFHTLSKLLATVDSRKGRFGLVRALDSISRHSSDLLSPPVVNILQDLNSFSTKRIDEPDFEKRLNALSQLSNRDEESNSKLSPKEWELLVQHSLFQIRDPDELSLRGSAASVLCRFLDITEFSTVSELQLLLQSVMIPGLKKVLRSKIEIVRQEILSVLAYATAKDFPAISELKEMRCLLVDGDKEANVFLNIYHIQVHRRIRALKRLGDESEAGRLSSKVLVDIFFPLLAHTFSPTGASRTDPDLVNEAVRTIGRIAQVLNWSAYNAVLQFYVKLIHKPTSVNKITVRVVVSILKNFHFSLHEKLNPTGSKKLQSAPGHACSSVSAKLIPTLIKFMQQQKDDGPDESLRIMIAEGVAYVATFLPEHDSHTAISGIISSLSNILKSTHQETRQSARITVGNIASLLPESFLPQIIKDLKAVLLRGPQLHVLAHTVYTIVSRISESKDFEIGTDSVKLLMGVIMDDLFGQPWKDRQSKELKAKTKFNETKTSRSLETLQMMISKLADSEILKDVLICFRQLLESTGLVKALKQVDECFNRICAGIVSNKEKFDAPEGLKLAHSLISHNVEYLKDKSQKKKAYVINPTDHRIVLSAKSKDRDGHYAANAHHFVNFGLNLFNTLYCRAGFDLHSTTYLPMIDPLVSVVGNTLYTHNAEVLGRGLKVMSILIKLPLPEVERSASIIIRQMLAVVNHIGNSESELSQIALKSLAAVIRDCKNVELTEKQLTGLLKMIAPDLQDPERQTTLFSLLRSIMSKKFMAPELYDLMDQILKLLVIAQSNQVREISRSIFLQFLLDYPQGKGRLVNSLEFIVKNLAYQHESGRQSVLEILNAINMKFSSQLVSKHSDLFMVALVMRVANEESVKCKEMAIEVLRVVFKRVELEKAGKYLEMLLSWSQPNPKGPIELRRAALQLIGAVVDVRGSEDDRRLEKVHHSLCATVDMLAAGFKDDEEDGEPTQSKKNTSIDWQTTYYSLQALSKVYQISNRLVFHSVNQTSNFPEWSAIQRFLLFPHVWVRTSASRLIGTLLSNVEEDDSKVWLFETSNLVELARKSSLQLRSRELDDSLAIQVVKNLFSLLKTIQSRADSSDNLVENVEDNPTTTNDLAEGEDEDGQSDSSGDGPQDGEDIQIDADPHGDAKATGASVKFNQLVKKLSRQASIAHAKRPSVFAVDASQWSIEPASILRCFAALANHLNADELTVILRPIMIPIFRILEDSNTKDTQMEELHHLAKEVQEFLREKVGSTCFTQIYGQLRTTAIEKRQARKNLIALKAVNQPELSAKRKISRSESKVRNKKRKQLAFSKQNALFGKPNKSSRLNQL